MKAILVIDLEDDTNLNNVFVRYVVQDIYGQPIKAEVGGSKLKPMPEKLKHWQYADLYKRWNISDKQINAEVFGYNKCIDEITGENE